MGYGNHQMDQTLDRQKDAEIDANPLIGKVAEELTVKKRTLNKEVYATFVRDALGSDRAIQLSGTRIADIPQKDLLTLAGALDIDASEYPTRADHHSNRWQDDNRVPKRNGSPAYDTSEERALK